MIIKSDRAQTLFPTIKIGIVGTGYLSNYFYKTFQGRDGIHITRVLTRRNMNECNEYPDVSVLTQNIDELIDSCDLVYECSGDPIHATDVIDKALKANKLVVTTNTEFHVTSGSYFKDLDRLTEADGDQPGALATLHRRAVNAGFKPQAYINMKGFLNHYPNPEEMHYWAKKQGISFANVTSFTDGTKIQFEQALVANGLGATFAKDGMLGLETHDEVKAARIFSDKARDLGQPISDYLIYRGAPHSVFVIAQHDDIQQPMLAYVKMGEGPNYILRQDAILLHLDVAQTIRDFYQSRRPLLNNSNHPVINVAAIAKRDIKAGEMIPRGIGSFDLRGEGVIIKNHIDALPIGLCYNIRCKRSLAKGEMLNLNDVEIPDSLALKAWMNIRRIFTC